MMAELFNSGRVVDLILLLVAAEGVALWVWHRRSGRGPSGLALIPNLVSGASLMLALRFALTGSSWIWIAVMMLCSLVAHGFDVMNRWRS